MNINLRDNCLYASYGKVTEEGYKQMVRRIISKILKSQFLLRVTAVV